SGNRRRLKRVSRVLDYWLASMHHIERVSFGFWFLVSIAEPLYGLDTIRRSVSVLRHRLRQSDPSASKSKRETEWQEACNYTHRQNRLYRDYGRRWPSDLTSMPEGKARGQYVDRQSCSQPAVHLHRSRAVDSHRRASSHPSDAD